ncbi:glucoamylase family protein [Enhygromyxa salina]|uniref:glucoamylase family protein n=1 Tax=Enhygromyxa salina TaxID=215803 RepID=UPI001C638DD7|nr:glucoamylase family protein [Enhygromyxa salina]
MSDDALVDLLQREAFSYFPETMLETGLVPDSTRPESPVSIAGVGLGLCAAIVGVARGLLTRGEALQQALAVLRLFNRSPQGPGLDTSGHRGFYYHYLDPATHRRAGRCELSSIDTVLLIAGFLTARQFYDRDDERELERRELADALYRRVDWRWMLAGGPTLSHGWRPERGFLNARWAGYTEALLLYVLASGSPTFPIARQCYEASTDEYSWTRIYGHDLLYAGPLFIHQLPQCWLDLRGISDPWLREHGIDYFENSRRATLVQQTYAVRNPREFVHYGSCHWGITASDGPGPSVHVVDGRRRRFWDYKARGVPYGPDDGTVAPWAAVTSLPFAPELVLPTIRKFIADKIGAEADSTRVGGRSHGFEASVNFSFPCGEDEDCWRSPWNYALNQGPLVLMTENYRTGLIWRLLRSCDYVVRGLRGAGFRGAWLD